MMKQSAWLQRVSRTFDRAASSYSSTAILQHEVATRLDQRLDLIKLNPKFILDLGTGPGTCLPLLKSRYPKATVLGIDVVSAMLQKAKKLNPWWQQRKFFFIQADAAQLPLKGAKIDLIVANFLLPWCENIQLLFQECQRVLAPEGLLLFSTLGPDTLTQLRQCFAQADPQHGHVNNFLDMHDVGDSLLQSNYCDAVMDVEYFTLTYSNLWQGLRELKAMGSCYLGPDHFTNLTHKLYWLTISKAYEALRDPQTQLLPATVEVIYGHAWKPKLSGTAAIQQEQKVHFVQRDKTYL